jgi:hypothetical protein
MQQQQQHQHNALYRNEELLKQNVDSSAVGDAAFTRIWEFILQAPLFSWNGIAVVIVVLMLVYLIPRIVYHVRVAIFWLWMMIFDGIVVPRAKIPPTSYSADARMRLLKRPPIIVKNRHSQQADTSYHSFSSEDEEDE